MNCSIKPDGAGAYGAVVHAALPTGEGSPQGQDLPLLDVTPLSMSSGTAGGIVTELIERGTTVSTKKGQTFMTCAGNQPGMLIQVSDGERALMKDSDPHGKFHLDGIPPAPRGVSHNEVTLDVDADSTFTELAQDNSVAKYNQITITKGDGPFSPKAQPMVKEFFSTQGEVIQEMFEIDSLYDDIDHSCSNPTAHLGEQIGGILKVKSMVQEFLNLHAAYDGPHVNNFLNFLVGHLPNFVDKRGRECGSPHKRVEQPHPRLCLRSPFGGALHTWTSLQFGAGGALRPRVTGRWGALPNLMQA